MNFFKIKESWIQYNGENSKFLVLSSGLSKKRKLVRELFSGACFLSSMWFFNLTLINFFEEGRNKILFNIPYYFSQPTF